MPNGILAIWHDIVPDKTADTLDWYNSEHHFERLAVPGFRNVRRYHAEAGAPFLFIRYETDDIHALSSKAYLERLNNPTPWTLQSQPQFRNNSRTVCERFARTSAGEGGYAVTLRMDRAPPTEWDWERTAGLMAQLRGVVGMEWWRADMERSSIPSREKQLRGDDDRYAGVVFVIHAMDRAGADAGLTTFLATLPLELANGAQKGIYRLAFMGQNSAS